MRRLRTGHPRMQMQMQLGSGALPQAIAIWTLETPGSMHQCLPWLPLRLVSYFLHATAWKMLCEEVLRACCSTMPVTSQIPKQPKRISDQPLRQQHNVLGRTIGHQGAIEGCKGQSTVQFVNALIEDEVPTR